MSDDLTGVFGGYIRTRRSGGTVYLDYIGDYGKAGNQNIEFGVNMIDVSESVSSDDIFTVLLPYGIIGTVPTQFFAGLLTGPQFARAAAAVAVFTVLSVALFRIGCKNYKSASS